MSRARRIVVLVAGIAVALGGGTLLALEGGEVVVLRTRAADGTTHETRTWIADDPGGAWIEAASPERPFLRDLDTNAAVDLWRYGAWRRCVAVVAENPAGHERIRGLLRAKYGWKDRWIGLVADTRGSLGVRLACEAT